MLRASLLFLSTTTTGSLGGLDGLLVALGRAALETAHEASSSLEGALEVADSGLAENVDLDQVGLEGTLEGDDGLDQERVGVFEVDVHESHHAHAHKLGAEQLLNLRGVVGVDGSGDELALLGRSHGRGLDILKGSQVYIRCQLQSILNAHQPSEGGTSHTPFFLLILI